jgi:nucleoid-associated protein YgaU
MSAKPKPAVIVDQGDTLSEIAERELGRASYWRVIAGMNRIRNPKLIQPGDILVLPFTGGTLKL